MSDSNRQVSSSTSSSSSQALVVVSPPEEVVVNNNQLENRRHHQRIPPGIRRPFAPIYSVFVCSFSANNQAFSISITSRGGVRMDRINNGNSQPGFGSMGFGSTGHNNANQENQPNQSNQPFQSTQGHLLHPQINTQNYHGVSFHFGNSGTYDVNVHGLNSGERRTIPYNENQNNAQIYGGGHGVSSTTSDPYTYFLSQQQQQQPINGHRINQPTNGRQQCSGGFMGAGHSQQMGAGGFHQNTDRFQDAGTNPHLQQQGFDVINRNGHIPMQAPMNHFHNSFAGQPRLRRSFSSNTISSSDDFPEDSFYSSQGYGK